MNNLKLYLDRLMHWLNNNPLVIAFGISILAIMFCMLILEPLLGSIFSILLMIALIAVIFIIVSNWDSQDNDFQ